MNLLKITVENCHAMNVAWVVRILQVPEKSNILSTFIKTITLKFKLMNLFPLLNLVFQQNSR